jgi:hypothetical protein
MGIVGKAGVIPNRSAKRLFLEVNRDEIGGRRGKRPHYCFTRYFESWGNRG